MNQSTIADGYKKLIIAMIAGCIKLINSERTTECIRKKEREWLKNHAPFFARAIGIELQ